MSLIYNLSVRPLVYTLITTALNVEVQHHHAHIVYVMAENNLHKEVASINLYGTGYVMMGCSGVERYCYAVAYLNFPITTTTGRSFYAVSSTLRGLNSHIPRQLPINDGGLALRQVIIAAVK